MAYLQQPESWLQQNSRPILGGLAGLGSLLTAYLTFNKLTERSAAFCTADGGCDLVLSSKWATFLGMPTAALGFLGFAGILVLAILPATLPLVKQWRWPVLFGLVSSMMAFEMYMLYLMVGVLQQFCLYCVTSIVLVVGLWLVTLLGHRWLDWGRLIFSYILISLFTLVATIGVYANQVPPASRLATELAAHLRQVNGTMYGAHWCPHCLEQKELFGSAFKQVPYVECSPNGGPGSPTAQVCLDQGIRSYPTWVINDKTYPGVKSLEALAALTDFDVDGDLLAPPAP
ncbi:MAG: vitamin K epoxide reductase family protein [Cyanobacteriota bacterium]|nr:vitamin K epoxide reductase family protein [Cyanobacteriota bacterium]